MARRLDDRFRPVRRSRGRRLSGLEWLERRQLFNMGPVHFPAAVVHFADFASPFSPPMGIVETFQRVHGPPEFARPADHYELQPPRGGLDSVSPFGIAAFATRMAPPLFGTADLRGDMTANRMLLLPTIDGQGGSVGDAPPPGDGGEQPPLHYFGLVHDFWAETRLAIFSLDAARPASVSPEGPGNEAGVPRHSSNGPVLGIQGRQSAESGALDFGAPSTVGHESVSTDDVTWSSTGGPREQASATVSHLVAFNDAEIGAANEISSSSAKTTLDPWDQMATALHELLTPRIACDAATLGVALADLMAEADELGVGLLGVLGYPTAVRPAALVAGLVGAGIAYRHWRGGREREAAEKRELLSARFIACQSLRLDRRPS